MDLHKIQQELKAPKNQYNNFGKYKYRSCEDILEAVKKVLPESVYLTVQDDIVEIGGRVYVKAIATLSDGKNAVSAQAFAREPDDKKGMDVSQVTGTASSYARKYALNGLFCIDDTRDADSEAPQKASNQKEFEDKKPAKPSAEEQKKNEIVSICKRIKEQLNLSDSLETLNYVWGGFVDNGELPKIEEYSAVFYNELKKTFDEKEKSFG